MIALGHNVLRITNNYRNSLLKRLEHPFMARIHRLLNDTCKCISWWVAKWYIIVCSWIIPIDRTNYVYEKIMYMVPGKITHYLWRANEGNEKYYGLRNDIRWTNTYESNSRGQCTNDYSTNFTAISCQCQSFLHQVTFCFQRTLLLSLCWWMTLR